MTVELTPQFSSVRKGTTANRPTSPALGDTYLDTTLDADGRPIFCASLAPVVWVTADGGVSAIPTVTSLVPATDVAAGGAAVAVHGTSFLAATDVLVDGVSAGAKGVDWTIVDDGEIDIAAIAAGGPGTVFIQVVSPLGTSATGAGSTFTYT